MHRIPGDLKGNPGAKACGAFKYLCAAWDAGKSPAAVPEVELATIVAVEKHIRFSRVDHINSY